LKYEALEICEVRGHLDRKVLMHYLVTLVCTHLKARYLHATAAVRGPFVSKVAYLLYITAAVGPL